MPLSLGSAQDADCADSVPIRPRAETAPIHVMLYNATGTALQLYQLDAKGKRTAHGTIGDLIFTPDKQFLITGGDEGEIKIWSLSKSKPERTFKAHKHQVVAFAMAPDGSRFATASLQDQEVALWETATGKELRRWPRLVVRNLAFAPDGKSVATANYNAGLYLLECP